MGIMNKMKFWKKGEEDDLGNLGDLGFDTKSEQGMNDFNPPAFEEHPSAIGESMSQFPPMTPDAQPSFSQQSFPQQSFPQQSFQQQPVQPRQQYPQQSFQQQAEQEFQSRAVFPQRQYSAESMEKDIDLLHAKIDTIKASLDAINQRLANIERLAQGDQKKRYEW